MKIFLDKHDEVTDAVEKIRTAEASEIDLAIPRDSLLAQGAVSFKLLKEFARRVGKKIRISSADLMVRRLAERAGLSVVGAGPRPAVVVKGEIPSSDAIIRVNTTKGKQTIGIKSYRDVKAGASEQSAESNPEIARSTAAPSREDKVVKLGPRVRPKTALIILAVLVLGGGAFWLFAPKATVIIHPEQRDFTALVGFNLDKSIQETDVTRKTVPAQLVEIEKAKQESFEASGEKNVGDKAKGIITIYNTYQTTPRTLSTVEFQDGSGKVYQSSGAVTIPGYTDTGGNITAGTIDVAVTATNPGEEYNLEPTTFIITTLATALQEKVYGRSATALSGGSNRTVKAVSKTDLARAKTALTEMLRAELWEELKTKRAEGIVLAESLVAYEEVADEPGKAENDEAETFEYTLKLNARALLFTEQKLTPLIEEKNRILLTDDWQPTTAQPELTYDVRSISFDDGIASVFLHLRRPAARVISPTDAVRLIRGMDKNAAQVAIKEKLGAEAVEIKTWPFWAQKIPPFEWRIDVEIVR